MLIKDRHIYFSTFTVQNWVSVFEDFPDANDIIVDSLDYLSKEEGLIVYAFVIMRDHIHIVWEMPSIVALDSISRRFRSFTGSNIIKLLKKLDEEYLGNFQSERKDRSHKYWKIGSNDYHLTHRDIVLQKIKYIHDNPTKGDCRSVEDPKDFWFSSARFYDGDASAFSFLKMFK